MTANEELDVGAIRSRLDAATPAPWKDDGDVSGIVAASGERVTEGDNSGYGCVYISDADRALIAHAPTDLRRLLDENARLNTALDEVHELWGAAERGRERADRQIRVHLDIARDAERARDEVRTEASRLYRALQQTAKRVEDDRDALAATVEALSARLAAKNAELDRVIQEAAADKAKLAELEGSTCQACGERTVRLQTEAGGSWTHHDGVNCWNRCADNPGKVWPQAAPGNEGWRGAYMHAQTLLEEAMRRIDALEPSPEMPRPPAEETREYRCRECDWWAPWTDGTLAEDNDGLALFWCQTCSAEMPLESMDSRPQERAGDTDTSPAGSGRGTGVAEASGTAQVADDV